MPDFEQLGFEVNATDNASTVLDRVIIRAEKLGITVNNNSNYYQKEERQINKNTNSLGKYLTKMTSLVVIARRLARFFSSAIQESANYIENLNLFAVAYGETYQETLGWALNLANSFGLANNEIVRFAGTFRELSSSLGIVGDTADTVTQVVTQLGYDLAALFNTTVEQAMEKLQSGVFSGNVRPLRAYGIDISQNQINALFETNEALARLGANARNLSQADKTIARLIITLQSGSDSFGTMSREINNLQSQFRIFQGSLANFKLAIGDLLEAPLRRIMVLINAVIIAMTNVIRVFSPLQTEDETPKLFTNIAGGAEEADEALEKLNGKLASFDKFNVLGGQGSGKDNTAITEALNKLLEEQAAIYNNELAVAMANMTNEATELAKKLEPIVAFGGAFLAVWSVAKIIAVVNGITTLKKAISLLSGGLVTLNKGISLTNVLLVSGIIYTIYQAVKAFRDGDKAVGWLAVSVGVVLAGAFLYLNRVAIASIIKSIANFIGQLLIAHTLITGSMKMAIWSLSASFIALGAAIAGAFLLFNNWADMNTWQRIVGVIGVLTTAVLGLAMAFGAFHSAWSLGLATAGIIAGITAMIVAFSSVKKKVQDPISYSAHADGGYSNANLIMTHENGKREWVGKAAGSSAIVNDTQMSDIMEIAVAKGVYSALTAKNATSGNNIQNQPIVVKIGEEAVFNAVVKTAKKQGKAFANI